MKEQIEEDTRIILARMARAKSDNDARHNRASDSILEIVTTLTDHSTKFDSIAASMSMLIENINM